MTQKIAIVNQKGGVGKTTICLHAGGALAEEGNKVLLVDMDQQGNLSSVFIKNIYNLPLTVADLLIGDEVEISQVIQKTPFPNIQILPSNLSLSDLDSKMAGDDDSQYYLMEELEEIKNSFNFILIDCPPNLGKATRMALVAADSVVIPIECQEWAVKGSAQILSYIDRVKQRSNPKLKLLGFVVNKYDQRRKIESNFNQILREKYGKQIFKTEFKNNVQYTESSTQRMPITKYLPKSEQAQAYRDFVREIINHG